MIERYYVVGVTGYPIVPGAAWSKGPERTSYSILDRYDAHREVRRYYVTKGISESDVVRRFKATAECQRLNVAERVHERLQSRRV